MPITEFQNTRKQIILADLPYAHETNGKYLNTRFVDPNDSRALAKCIKNVMDNVLIQNQRYILKNNNFKSVSSWEKLISIIST